MSTKFKDDYSFIRGFCDPNGHRKPIEQVKKELGYAQRLQLNSSRIWLSYRSYESDPETFLTNLRTYVQTAYEMGFTTMPVLWNGSSIAPDIIEQSYFPAGDEYVKAVVEALKDEPGIIMWDIMNEPSYCDYFLKSPPEELDRRKEYMWEFLRHYCRLTKKLDPDTPINIGHTFVDDIEPTIDDIDVMAFHDYSQTRRKVRNKYDIAVALQKKYNKPFINSELACLCRANPYDVSLEICSEYKTGWYLFELMIDGFWREVHGIFYPDGTIRDPSIVAAVLGFYRNRSETAVIPNPDREGHARGAINKVRDALSGTFRRDVKPIDAVLEAAEICANLLECCELVPMTDGPMAKIERLRAMPQPDMKAARKLAFDLAELLRVQCQLL